MTEPSAEQTEALIAAQLQLQDTFAADCHRPAYHFVPPAGWMNDINGAIYWRGRYHIFYQLNPHAAYWYLIQWGHASSVDLLHWVHHPVALTPDADGPDRGGCYSGGAFVNKEGVPTLIYYGFRDGICLATSHDDLLLRWEKHPDNPVIPTPVEGDPEFGRYQIHDPCAWLDGDTYYSAINRRQPNGEGDGAYLFRSTDLRHWDFVDLFYRSRREWTEAEEDCAVPDFFPLGDRHMLLFCSHLIATQYYIGHLEGELFIPETHGRMSWFGGQLGGPRTLVDAEGRRIYLDWMREIRGRERERASGWSGAMTLPRVLSLDADRQLLIEPVPEIEKLRVREQAHPDRVVEADGDVVLDGIEGSCLEIMLQVDPIEAAEVGVWVFCSPDGNEQTEICCDLQAGELRIDVSASTLDPDIAYTRYRQRVGGRQLLEEVPGPEHYTCTQIAPFRLDEGETLTLHIFLDRSILEVFANGRQCITQRVYPTRSDSVTVRAFARDGGARFSGIRAWELASTQP